MKTITNKIPRSILYFYDLSKEHQDEALGDYPDAEHNQYFVYKRDLYCLAGFLKFDHEYFHGVQMILFGYAIAVRVVGGDQLIVGTLTQ
jgi:hypothetical protein